MGFALVVITSIGLSLICRPNFCRERWRVKRGSWFYRRSQRIEKRCVTCVSKKNANDKKKVLRRKFKVVPFASLAIFCKPSQILICTLQNHPGYTIAELHFVKINQQANRQVQQFHIAHNCAL